MNTQVDIVELRRLHESAMEEVRRLTQANTDIRKERDRAVKEAQRQDSVAKGLRRELRQTLEALGGVAQPGVSEAFLILGVSGEAAALKRVNAALAADNERLRKAMEQALEGAARQLAEPRNHDNDQYALTAIATTCELALAATPAQSLAAHDAALLRKIATKFRGDLAKYWDRTYGAAALHLEAEADRIERGQNAK